MAQHKFKLYFYAIGERLYIKNYECCILYYKLQPKILQMFFLISSV